MHAALEQRIQQLEADNESLAAAASQAAALVEEYAADAAAYRRGTPVRSEADNALVTELTDATRRKDRRINRLSSLLNAEKENVARLSTRISELEEVIELADEMEVTLRASVQALQDRVTAGGERVGVRADPLERVSSTRPEVPDLCLSAVESRVVDAVLCAFERYFPSTVNVQGDTAAFRVLRSAFSTMGMISYLKGKLSRTEFRAQLQDFFDLFVTVSERAETAARWCFEKPAEVSSRGPSVEKEVLALEERTRTLCSDFAALQEAVNWSPSFAQMKVDLVVMALDSLNATLPPGFGGAFGSDMDALFSEVGTCAAVRGEEVASSLTYRCNTSTTDGEATAELKSKLEATKSMLSRRNRELDDLRVRSKVFEERLSSKQEDAKQLDAMRRKVSQLEDELGSLQKAKSTSKGVASSPRAGAETSPTREDGPTAPAVRHLDEVDDTREAARLRRTLVRRQLADLQALPVACGAEVEVGGRDAGLREKVWEALESAREAASRAQAVRLDRETLLPIVGGEKMSKGVVLQALALSRKPAA